MSCFELGWACSISKIWCKRRDISADSGKQENSVISTDEREAIKSLQKITVWKFPSQVNKSSRQKKNEDIFYLQNDHKITWRNNLFKTSKLSHFKKSSHQEKKLSSWFLLHWFPCNQLFMFFFYEQILFQVKTLCHLICCLWPLYHKINILKLYQTFILISKLFY